MQFTLYTVIKHQIKIMFRKSFLDNIYLKLTSDTSEDNSDGKEGENETAALAFKSKGI